MGVEQGGDMFDVLANYIIIFYIKKSIQAKKLAQDLLKIKLR